MPYVTKFTVFTPNLNIILSNDYIVEKGDLQTELGFDCEDIIIYSDNISGDK
jgi:hypothetical protein